jgi:hypothetical protein
LQSISIRIAIPLRNGIVIPINRPIPNKNRNSHSILRIYFVNQTRP